MADVHELPESPRQYAEQVLTRSNEVLRAVVAIVSPEEPDADPLKVFPAPSQEQEQSRETSPGMSLSTEQIVSLNAAAAELGFGEARNVLLSEQGLTDAIVVLEGGQPHKILAEARVVAEDIVAQPRAIIIAASGQRKITGSAELESARRLFGGDQDGKTEYDMALQAIAQLPTFRKPYPSEVQGVNNLAYDIHDGYVVSSKPSGQFVRIGYLGEGLNSVSVTMMRIDREDYKDASGVPRYGKQPDTASILGIVDQMLKLSGDRSPVALVTSGTYRPSRTLGVALAGLKASRLVGLATYGSNLLNEVRGSSKPAPINQLPGELHYMAAQAKALDEFLHAS